MKIFQTFVLSVAFTFALANAQIVPSFDWYNNDKNAETFTISTAGDLSGLAALVDSISPVRFAGKTIKLANNIDLGGEIFRPIGDTATNVFYGTFDGQGHTISGLNVNVVKPNSGSIAYAGLFGYVGTSGTGTEAISGQVKNLNVIVSKVVAEGKREAYAGGLIGYYNSIKPIENCSVKADSIISNSMTAYAGGLIGYTKTYSLEIENSNATGNTVTIYGSSNSYAGGLVGYADAASAWVYISNSHASGSVLAKNAGGLIGYAKVGSNARQYVVRINDSWADVDVFANTYQVSIGGLIGQVDGPIARITNSYFSGNIFIELSTGAGFMSQIGGFIGQAKGSYMYGDSLAIVNSYSSGNIFVTNNYPNGFYLGGFIGNITGNVPLIFRNSYFNGNISLKDPDNEGSYYVGGFLGYYGGNDSKLMITNSYANGEISGQVLPRNRYGAILGYYYFSESSEFYSAYYNSGKVSNPAGQFCNGPTNCTTEFVAMEGISGKSENDLKKRATFINYDFDDVWGIIENSSTPFLKNDVGYFQYLFPSPTYSYTGSQITPEPTIWRTSTGTVLTKGTHYTLSYGDNKNVGKATITVTGINAYAGLSRIINFNIEPKELTVSGAQATKIYDGNTGVTIMGAMLQGVCGNDDVSLAGTAGELASANAGTDIPVAFQMSLIGDDSYNYKLTQPILTGNITPKPLSNDFIQPIIAQLYKNGAEIAPEITLKDGTIALVEDEDYTVPSYANNSEIGIASVTVQGKGNYGGSATAEFKIVPALFTETFENGQNGWVLVNGSQTNKWVIGTATNNNGSYSAYISNNGSANDYTITSTSNVHLYKDIAFPESYSDFFLTYSFKGMGESGYDYLSVRASTTSSTPSAGSAFSSGNQLGTTSFNESTWTQKTITLPAATYSGKTMRLVFSWRNNASKGTTPPAAIDDISIYTAAEVAPIMPTPTIAEKTHSSITVNAIIYPIQGQEVEYAASATNTAPTSASSWQTGLTFSNLSPNTTYYIFARAKQNESHPTGSPSASLSVKTDLPSPANLPLVEGFENGENGWIFASGTETNKWIIGTATRNNGSRSAYVSNNNSSNQYTSPNYSEPHPIHLYRDITFPTSNSDFTLTFYFKGVGHNSGDYMYVYHGSTTSTAPSGGLDYTGGTRLGTYYEESSWVKKTINLPRSTFSGQTKRLVFTWVNYNTYANNPPAAIDDICIIASGGSCIAVSSSSSGGVSSSSSNAISSSSKPSSSSNAVSSSSSNNSSSSDEDDSSSSSYEDSSSSEENDSSSSSYEDSSSSYEDDSSSSSEFEISFPGGDSSSSNGTTPVLLPQIAKSNGVLQTKNGIDLQAKSSAVVEVYGLNGNLISRQSFGSGVYSVSYEHLPKGLYIVKVSFGGSEKKLLKIPLR